MAKKYKSISDYFRSDEFKKDFQKSVEKDTWGKGLPMAYRHINGDIVKHWKDGRIEVVKKAKRK